MSGVSTVRSSYPRLTSFAFGLVLGVAVALLAIAALYVTGPDPRPGKCPAGSFPATNIQVGGDCFKDGSTLPEGYSPDPGGNDGLSG